jgi:nicotinate-nucleotide pyrophosphorylase (carboxylating)
VKSIPFGPLDPSLYREAVRRALAEDLGWGDVTTQATVPGDASGRGRLVACAACVVAGLDVAEEVFRQLDPVVRVTRLRHDGERCAEGDLVGTIEGRAAAMLTAARTALSFLDRLTAIATTTQRFVAASGGRVVVLDTRQALPLWRALDKYAVRAGGGTNHHASLDEGVVIEAAHARCAGGLGAAVSRVRAAAPDMPIEVEVTSLAEAEEAIGAGATRLLVTRVDDGLAELVRRTRGRAQVEVASAGDLGDVDTLASCGVDFISIAALTAAPSPARFHFDVQPA